LFRVNDMIMEVVSVHHNRVECAIISPLLRMGEILQYDRDFVAQKVLEYIHLL